MSAVKEFERLIKVWNKKQREISELNAEAHEKKDEINKAFANCILEEKLLAKVSFDVEYPGRVVLIADYSESGAEDIFKVLELGWQFHFQLPTAHGIYVDDGIIRISFDDFKGCIEFCSLYGIKPSTSILREDLQKLKSKSSKIESAIFFLEGDSDETQ